MSKLLLGSAALAVLAASPVMAADMRMPVKAPPPVIAYSWTGCYLGGNIGVAWHRRDNTLSIANDPVNPYFATLAIPGVNASGSPDFNQNGFTGGAQIGCNYQASNVVWGVEGDFESLRRKTEHGGTFLYTTNGAPYRLTVDYSTRWLATLRGRVGVAWDRTLFYVTGGLAVTSWEFQQAFSEAAISSELASASKTKLGWTIGAGVEGALIDNWTVKAEYLYARFEGETVLGQLVTNNGNGATFSNSLSDLQLHIFRVGLNYRFGPTAVVAKY
jgi:outer membrane immunogenic protein